MEDRLEPNLLPEGFVRLIRIVYLVPRPCILEDLARDDIHGRPGHDVAPLRTPRPMELPCRSPQRSCLIHNELVLRGLLIFRFRGLLSCFTMAGFGALFSPPPAIMWLSPSISSATISAT